MRGEGEGVKGLLHAHVRNRCPLIGSSYLIGSFLLSFLEIWSKGSVIRSGMFIIFLEICPKGSVIRSGMFINI